MSYSGPGMPRDTETSKQYAAEKQRRYQSEADSRHEAHEAHQGPLGLLRRLFARRRSS